MKTKKTKKVVLECRITPHSNGYWQAGEYDEVWYESEHSVIEKDGDLIKEYLSELPSRSGRQIYVLGEDDLPDEIEDIRGVIYEEPPTVYAYVEKTGKAQYWGLWEQELETNEEPDNEPSDADRISQLTGLNAYPHTLSKLWEALPDSCQNLTGEQIADILKAINIAYNEGRASAGAEVHDGAVYINALKKLFPLAVLARLKSTELNTGNKKVEIWEYHDPVGEKIEKFRKQNGWTQTELAKRLKVTTSLVSAWETGKRIPKKETRERIAEALGIVPWALY